MSNVPTDVIQAAQAAQAKWGTPASVQIAQWALESGWGQSEPGNNSFGMKPRAGCNDPYQMLWTTEWSTLRRRLIKVQQPFRKFASRAACFDAHAELLATAKVYAPAMAMLPNVSAYIDKMAPKYATAPDYARQLKALILQQRLSAFDAKKLTVA